MKCSVDININEFEKNRLFDMLGFYGLSVDDLISSFFCDLVGSGNGADERILINDWFCRNWFTISPDETLLKYCLEYGFDIDYLLTLWDENEYFKTTTDIIPKWIEEDLHDFLDDYKDKYPEKDITEQIEICKKWFLEKRDFDIYEEN